MQRVWPIIGVSDVRRSANWYTHLLGAHATRAGGDTFEQVLTSDFEVLLCLHQWGPLGTRTEEEWTAFRKPVDEVPGQGLLLWFVVDDFDAAWARAQIVASRIVEPPNINNGTGLRAFVVLDLDNYCVAVNEG